MTDALGKLTAGFLAVLLLFIFPILHMAESQEDTTRLFVLSETTKFVDAVRDTGLISENLLQEYRTKLSATGILYDIEMEHRHKVYHPIYSDPYDMSSFTGDYHMAYEGFYTKDILAALLIDNYRMSKGDYFSITIVNKTHTFAGKIRSLLLRGALPQEVIFVRYGGMIRFENN